MLAEILARATAGAPAIDTPEWALADHVVKGGAAELIEALRAVRAYRMFDNNMQLCGTSAQSTGYDSLAIWLIRTTQQAGPQVAIERLTAYVQADAFPCKAIAAVTGIRVAGEHALGHGMTLMPWGSLPASEVKKDIDDHFRMSGTLTAALVWSFNHPRIHYELGAPEGNRVVDVTPLDDMLLCIGLQGPCAPYSVATGFVVADDVPLFSSAVTIRPFAEAARLRSWFGSADKTNSHYSAWQALSESRRTALRLPLSRLNLAMRRLGLADAAIDLGITFESLFLNDLGPHRGELSYRLRVRAARWLGRDEVDRRQLYTLLTNLYECRSSAAHQGVLENSYRGVAPDEILDRGFVLAARSLERLIVESPPDWERIVLA